MVDRKSLALGACCFVAVLAAVLVFHVFGRRDAASPVGVLPADVNPLPLPAAKPGDPLAKADPHSNAGWEQRLARQDEILVDQVVAVGCDAARAAKFRTLLAAKEAHRSKAIADLEAGKITEDAMHESAHAQKVAFEAAVKELLTPAELDALDPVAARAQVISEEKKPR